MNYNFDNILVFGDVHGEWRYLNNALCHIPKNSCVIQVGDFGLGFDSFRHDLETCSVLSNTLKITDSKMFVIRGNHDDPSFFNGNKKIENLQNIKFLSDYTYININNKKFLFVGGAVSIDRTTRLIGRSYWEDEKINKIDLNILEECDVLILHSAPNFCYPIGYDSPIVKFFAETDVTLIDELKDERNYLKELVEKVKPKKVYYGHFHDSNCELIEKCEYNLLNELEIKQIN